MSLAFVRGIHRSPVNSPHKGILMYMDYFEKHPSANQIQMCGPWEHIVTTQMMIQGKILETTT